MASSNPYDELNGLRDGLIAATTGAISRAVTGDRGYDGFWTGPWPLIDLPDFSFRIDRLFGGVGSGGRGQDARRPSFYTVTLQDVVDVRKRTPTSTLVAASQDDLIVLIGAIVSWFAVGANQCLPDAHGVPRAHKAGEHMEFKMASYRSEDGGETRVVAAGRISVQGVLPDG